MTVPANQLDLAVYVHMHLNAANHPDRGVVAGVLSDECDFDEIVGALERHGMSRTWSGDRGTRYLEFNQPANYFETEADLLLSPGRRVKMPSKFYIEQTGLLYPNANTDHSSFIKGYLDASKLFCSLEKLADDIRDKGTNPRLVWLGQSKLEITNEYQASDLAELPRLAEFVDQFIDSEPHQKQKKHIIKDVLFKLFDGESQVLFSSVIKQFDAVVAQTEASYELYMSEFSFQKVMSKVEEQKLAFTSQINRVLADIQNQLLAVPVAVILIGGQMRPKGHVDLSNVLIWLGSLVFTIFVFFMVSNQRHTLRTVHEEINRQWQLIEGDHRTIAPRFEPVYKQLEKRYKHQLHLLGAVSAIVIASLIFSSWLLCHYSH